MKYNNNTTIPFGYKIASQLPIDDRFVATNVADLENDVKTTWYPGMVVTIEEEKRQVVWLRTSIGGDNKVLSSDFTYTTGIYAGQTFNFYDLVSTGYKTVDAYGAVGDGVANDANAFRLSQEDQGIALVKSGKTYLIANLTISDLTISGFAVEKEDPQIPVVTIVDSDITLSYWSNIKVNCGVDFGVIQPSSNLLTAVYAYNTQINGIEAPTYMGYFFCRNCIINRTNTAVATTAEDLTLTDCLISEIELPACTLENVSGTVYLKASSATQIIKNSKLSIKSGDVTISGTLDISNSTFDVTNSGITSLFVSNGATFFINDFHVTGNQQINYILDLTAGYSVNSRINRVTFNAGAIKKGLYTQPLPELLGGFYSLLITGGDRLIESGDVDFLGGYSMYFGVEAADGISSTGQTYPVNTAMGYAAAKDSDVAFSTFYGSGAGREVESTVVNLAAVNLVGIGGNALRAAKFNNAAFTAASGLVTGIGNSAFENALFTSSFGGMSVASGTFAGRDFEGSFATLYGVSAGELAVGSNLIYSGTNTGRYITGSRNIFIGDYIGDTVGHSISNAIMIGGYTSLTNPLSNLNNYIAIGFDLIPSVANSIIFPNTYNMALGHNAPTEKLDIIGNFNLRYDGVDRKINWINVTGAPVTVADIGWNDTNSSFDIDSKTSNLSLKGADLLFNNEAVLNRVLFLTGGVEVSQTYRVYVNNSVGSASVTLPDCTGWEQVPFTIASKGGNFNVGITALSGVSLNGVSEGQLVVPAGTNSVTLVPNATSGNWEVSEDNRFIYAAIRNIASDIPIAINTTPTEYNVFGGAYDQFITNHFDIVSNKIQVNINDTAIVPLLEAEFTASILFSSVEDVTFEIYYNSVVIARQIVSSVSTSDVLQLHMVGQTLMGSIGTNFGIRVYAASGTPTVNVINGSMNVKRVS